VGTWLLGGEVLAHGGEIEDDDLGAVLAETSGGAGHQRALAHLAAGEHVAELALLEGVEEVAVGLAFDVGGRVGA
jgi:hypothetical protein